jgi:histidinol-phosphate aminotransferase
MDEIQNEVAQLISERKRLKEELECCVSYIEKVYPSEGNFLLLKVDDATKRYNQLIDLGVVIRNRTTQPLCENCLRISVGICEENQKLLRALKSLK